MAERVFIGADGSTFKLRVSRPGFDARTASENNLVLHENQRPMVPIATGTVSVASGSYTSQSSVTVNLNQSFSTPPKIILRTATNRIASHPTLYCTLDLSDGTLRIYNGYPTSQVVRYVVFAPF